MSIQSSINQLLSMAGSLSSSIRKSKEKAVMESISAPKSAPGATPQETLRQRTTQPSRPLQRPNNTRTGGAPSQPMQRTRESVLQDTARKIQEGLKQRDGRRSFMDYIRSGEAGKEISKKFTPYERRKIMNKIDAQRREKDGGKN